MRLHNSGGNLSNARSLGRLVIAAALVVACATGTTARAAEDDAKAILKSMSDYLSGQSTISLTFDSDIEVITPQMEKIQFTNSGETLLRRPDKLRARRVGGYSDVELVFDGKTTSILGQNVNGYAQFELPVPWTAHQIRSGRVMALPCRAVTFS